jgi:hypothetical protein
MKDAEKLVTHHIRNGRSWVRISQCCEVLKDFVYDNAILCNLIRIVFCVYKYMYMIFKGLKLFLSTSKLPDDKILTVTLLTFYFRQLSITSKLL